MHLKLFYFFTKYTPNIENWLFCSLTWSFVRGIVTLLVFAQEVRIPSISESKTAITERRHSVLYSALVENL